VRIVALVKEVPDTYGDRRITLETGLVDRDAGERVLDEIGERAVEAALSVQAAVPESTVTVVTMAPAGAADSLRRALAMGADDAVHVCDDDLVGADVTLTAEVLAEAVRRHDADLVITGNASTDGGGGVMGALLAEHLGFAQITNLSSLTATATTVAGTRATDAGTAQVEAALPAVVGITEGMPDARYPSLKGIMAAKKKPIATVTAAELDADVLGVKAARAIVIAARERPPRSAGVTITDEGDAGVQLARFLIDRKLA
jgi:electron transfer flavoprotein beta subunit